MHSPLPSVTATGCQDSGAGEPPDSTRAACTERGKMSEGIGFWEVAIIGVVLAGLAVLFVILRK